MWTVSGSRTLKFGLDHHVRWREFPCVKGSVLFHFACAPDAGIFNSIFLTMIVDIWAVIFISELSPLLKKSGYEQN